MSGHAKARKRGTRLKDVSRLETSVRARLERLARRERSERRAAKSCRNSQNKFGFSRWICDPFVLAMLSTPCHPERRRGTLTLSLPKGNGDREGVEGPRGCLLCHAASRRFPQNTLSGFSRCASAMAREMFPDSGQVSGHDLSAWPDASIASGELRSRAVTAKINSALAAGFVTHSFSRCSQPLVILSDS